MLVEEQRQGPESELAALILASHPLHSYSLKNEVGVLYHEEGVVVIHHR